MCVYLRTKFQVCSIILTSFRQEVVLPPTSKRLPKKPTQIRVKDTNREKVSSNETQALTESIKMGIWVVGTSSQLFIKGSYTKIQFSKIKVLLPKLLRSILYSPSCLF